MLSQLPSKCILSQPCNLSYSFFFLFNPGLIFCFLEMWEYLLRLKQSLDLETDPQLTVYYHLELSKERCKEGPSPRRCMLEDLRWGVWQIPLVWTRSTHKQPPFLFLIYTSVVIMYVYLFNFVSYNYWNNILILLSNFTIPLHSIQGTLA